MRWTRLRLLAGRPVSEPDARLRLPPQRAVHRSSVRCGWWKSRPQPLRAPREPAAQDNGEDRVACVQKGELLKLEGGMVLP